jgi:hypothetical protein
MWGLRAGFPVTGLGNSKRNNLNNLGVICIAYCSPQLPTIQKGAQDFLLSYSEGCQIWLNILMDDHHLTKITKLKK